MATITGKDLDIKDLNARLQAICLKMNKAETLQLGNFKVSQEKFKVRRKELNQTTIGLMLPHIQDVQRYHLYGNRAKLFSYMLPILDGTQLRQLFKQNHELVATKAYSGGEVKLKPFKGQVSTDPEWNTIYASSIEMERNLRQYMLQGLDPGDSIRHLARYPQDIDLVPLDAAGVTELATIIEKGKHAKDVVDSLCANESDALLPVYMKLINEGCFDYDGPQLEVIDRLHAAGYKISCVPPALPAGAATAPAEDNIILTPVNSK